jgi:hypothetical protein
MLPLSRDRLIAKNGSFPSAKELVLEPSVEIGLMTVRSCAGKFRALYACNAIICLSIRVTGSRLKNATFETS